MNLNGIKQSVASKADEVGHSQGLWLLILVAVTVVCLAHG